MVLAGSSVQAQGIEEHVDTLDIIEVPGTPVIREARDIVLPRPDMTTMFFLPLDKGLLPSSVKRSLISIDVSRTVRDPIADSRGVLIPVRPTKAERPPYPRFARQQGWEGVVVLRLTIRADGTVASVSIQTPSPYPILDESAAQTVQQWQFDPAKDGEIPIQVTVDVPIRFSLDQ